jgi:hypothetical protein
MTHIKYSLLFLFLFLSMTTVFSQAMLTNSHEFDQFQRAGGGGISAFKTNFASDADGSQFFLPDWGTGDVVLNNNIVFSSGMLFNYDKVRQELFIKQTDSSLVLLGNKEDIKGFSLMDAGKEFNFVNSSVYSKKKPEFFYQVLLADSSRLTLLKYTKGTFVKADHTDMMKQREGKVNDAFVDKVTYYISKQNGNPEEIQLKSKSVKKTFADININIDKYISDHPGSVDEDYLVSMVTELNK